VPRKPIVGTLPAGCARAGQGGWSKPVETSYRSANGVRCNRLARTAVDALSVDLIINYFSAS